MQDQLGSDAERLHSAHAWHRVMTWHCRPFQNPAAESAMDCNLSSLLSWSLSQQLSVVVIPDVRATHSSDLISHSGGAAAVIGSWRASC